MAKVPHRRVTIAVDAPLIDAKAAEDRPSTAAYAFSSGGRFLGRTPLDEKGLARLEIEASAEAAGVRLLVGPVMSDDTPNLAELVRRGAQERHLRIDPEAAQAKVSLKLPPDIWRCWLGRFCVVKGTAVKRVVVHGVAKDFPVCNATVEIYEVDPISVIIPKIPKDILDRLRHIVLTPIPVPPIPPGPGPDPVPFAARSIALGAGNAPTPEPMALTLDPSLRAAALAGSDLTLRRELIVNAEVVRPILCWYFPHFVVKHLIATTETDDCGHFRETILQSCNNHDQADLYFKLKQQIFGPGLKTIYAPTPVACHTWWNYVCGTEVTLHVTDPLAITCQPCPPVIAGDNWVLFMAIGNHPLSKIYGTSEDHPVTDASQLGLTTDGAPWGGLLRPRIEFDNALRAMGVDFYRLSWKRDTDVAYTPLSGTVNRHYAHKVGTALMVDAYNLGPKTKGAEGNLFEIPPALPPLGQWSIPDAVEDTTSGKLDTTAIADSKIQLKLELFDSAGAPVNIGAKGIRFFVPTSEDLSGTVETENATTLGLVSGNAMIITLRVNNEKCTASIAAPTIGTAVADPCCGVLGYSGGETVGLAWQASHPHQFANYSFGIVRGASGVASQGGAVAGGSFSIAPTVDDLMNTNLPPGCASGGCTVAGFSEQLYVATTATDGWGRQAQYDASAVRAFVLAKK